MLYIRGTQGCVRSISNTFPTPCKIRAESGFVLFVPASLRVGTLDFLAARLSFSKLFSLMVSFYIASKAGQGYSLDCSEDTEFIY